MGFGLERPGSAHVGKAACTATPPAPIGGLFTCILARLIGLARVSRLRILAVRLHQGDPGMQQQRHARTNPGSFDTLQAATGECIHQEPVIANLVLWTPSLLRFLTAQVLPPNATLVRARLRVSLSPHARN
jgi:hypothetical protein